MRGGDKSFWVRVPTTALGTLHTVQTQTRVLRGAGLARMGGDKTWHCTSLLANDMPVYLLSKSTTASSTQSKSIRTLSSFDKLCLLANIQIADTIPNNLQHLPSLVGWMVSHSHFQISTLSVSLDTHGVLVDHRMQYPASKL